MKWIVSDRCDPVVRPLADRHYNRQSIGAPNFVPPGRCLVLRTADAKAFWVTSWPFAEYVRHAWGGAFVCSAFRNEGAALSSDMITEAVAATIAVWRPPSVETWVYGPSTPHVTMVERTAVSMVTFVDPDQTRAKRDPGRCFRRAKFEPIGETKGGLVALGLRLDRLPPAAPAMRVQGSLWA